MKKIISYHPNKSTGIGGIETLVRSLQLVAKRININFAEYFNSIAADGNELYSVNNSNVDYVKIPLPLNITGQLREAVKGFLFALKLISFSRREGELVIIYHPIYFLFLFKLVLRGRGVVLVQSNRLDSLFEGRLVKLAFFLNSKNITKFTVYTKYDREKLSGDYNFEYEKIAVIPRGCKLPTKSTSSAFGKSLVTITRIYEHQKNLDAMIEALKILPLDYTLDIYGSGTNEEIKSLQQKICDMDRVNYKGSTSDVGKTLEEYNIFLMTSNYEGFGQTLIEARSQGLPIVVFDNFEAAQWIVKNGDNGFLIKNKNIQDFSEKVLFISSSPETYQSFSDSAIQLSIETDINHVESLWKDLLLAHTGNKVPS